MRRRPMLTAVCLLGGTLLPGLAAVAIFGCCALPFHGLVHRVMPLCQIATAALAGHHDDHAPALPAHRESPKTTIDPTASRPSERPSFAPVAAMSAVAPRAAGVPLLRSLPLGAFRCDDDVGSRLAFVETLRL